MSGWSELPLDIILLIARRLDAVGFFRFRAACIQWHRSMKYYFPFTPLPWYRCSPKSKLPWLLLTSSPVDDPDSRFFYHLCDRKPHQLRLPDIAGHRFIGSSHGFLISLDAEANIHAANPLTGVRLPLPPTSTFPRIRGYSLPLHAHLFQHQIRHYLTYKAILSPSGHAVAVLNRDFGWLAFARPGDESWATHYPDAGMPANWYYYFQDAIFHSGRLHAVCYTGGLVVFDPEPPHRVTRFSTYTGPQPYENISYLNKRYLVESPDGESLFLLKRFTEVGRDDVVRTTDVKVSVLVDTKWTPVKQVKHLAFFLGLNYSTCLNAGDNPGIKGNRVYLTQDEDDWLMGYRKEAACSGVEVFNLEDGSIQALYSDQHLTGLRGSPPIWFTPTLI